MLGNWLGLRLLGGFPLIAKYPFLWVKIIIRYRADGDDSRIIRYRANGDGLIAKYPFPSVKIIGSRHRAANTIIIR